MKIVSGLAFWINRDPIEESGGKLLYGYCGNDSIGNCDMLGMKDNDIKAIEAQVNKDFKHSGGTYDFKVSGEVSLTAPDWVTKKRTYTWLKNSAAVGFSGDCIKTVTKVSDGPAWVRKIPKYSDCSELTVPEVHAVVPVWLRTTVNMDRGAVSEEIGHLLQLRDEGVDKYIITALDNFEGVYTTKAAAECFASVVKNELKNVFVISAAKLTVSTYDSKEDGYDQRIADYGEQLESAKTALEDARAKCRKLGSKLKLPENPPKNQQ